VLAVLGNGLVVFVAARGQNHGALRWAFTSPLKRMNVNFYEFYSSFVIFGHKGKAEFATVNIFSTYLTTCVGEFCL
jgi:hypothetical protein